MVFSERITLMNISLFASANRTQWWERLYNSLQGNKCSWEIVFVGPNPPTFDLPINFRYYYCPFKPTQCYAAASYFCTGELIGWTADDAVYDSKSLDVIYSRYKWYQGFHQPKKKIIFTQRTIENGKDVSEEHHFFRHCKDTPQMAPMAFMNREWFRTLKGYDRNFVSGQAENSIVMDALADGGEIENISNSIVYLNHEEVHGGFWNKVKYRLYKNSFRSGYFNDRRYLEECWVKEGYGTYDEKTLNHGTISNTRLLAHQPFEYTTILTKPQGPQGRFYNANLS